MVDIAAILRLLLQTLTIPFASPPGDAQIYLGEPPGCLASRYSSALIFWPAGSQVGGIGGPPGIYFGQVATGIPFEDGLEMGYVVRDETGGVCGYVATNRFGASNDGTGALDIRHYDQIVQVGGSGVSVYDRQNVLDGAQTSFGDGFSTIDNWQMIFGDATRIILGQADAEMHVTLGAIEVWDGAAVRFDDGAIHTYAGRQLARGIIGRGATNSAVGLNTSYADLLLVPDVPFGPNRTFEVNFRADVSTSTTTNVIDLQCLSGSGPTLIEALPTFGPNTVAGRRSAVWGSFLIKNNTGSLITADLILQAKVSAGTGSAQPVVVWIEDKFEDFTGSGAVPAVVA